MKKSLSHGPSPGSLAGDPFGMKMETIERKLQMTSQKIKRAETYKGLAADFRDIRIKNSLSQHIYLGLFGT